MNINAGQEIWNEIQNNIDQIIIDYSTPLCLFSGFEIYKSFFLEQENKLYPFSESFESRKNKFIKLIDNNYSNFETIIEHFQLQTDRLAIYFAINLLLDDYCVYNNKIVEKTALRRKKRNTEEYVNYIKLIKNFYLYDFEKITIKYKESLTDTHKLQSISFSNKIFINLIIQSLVNLEEEISEQRDNEDKYITMFSSREGTPINRSRVFIIDLLLFIVLLRKKWKNIKFDTGSLIGLLLFYARPDLSISQNTYNHSNFIDLKKYFGDKVRKHI